MASDDRRDAEAPPPGFAAGIAWRRYPESPAEFGESFEAPAPIAGEDAGEGAGTARDRRECRRVRKDGPTARPARARDLGGISVIAPGASRCHPR